MTPSPISMSVGFHSRQFRVTSWLSRHCWYRGHLLGGQRAGPQTAICSELKRAKYAESGVMLTAAGIDGLSYLPCPKLLPQAASWPSPIRRNSPRVFPVPLTRSTLVWPRLHVSPWRVGDRHSEAGRTRLWSVQGTQQFRWYRASEYCSVSIEY